MAPTNTYAAECLRCPLQHCSKLMVAMSRELHNCGSGSFSRTASQVEILNRCVTVCWQPTLGAVVYSTCMLPNKKPKPLPYHLTLMTLPSALSTTACFAADPARPYAAPSLQRVS